MMGIFILGSSAQKRSKQLQKSIDLVWKGIGGKQAWEKARYFQFTFSVQTPTRTTERTHLWDRYTGQYRLQFTTKDKKDITVLFNTNKPDSGLVYMGDNLLTKSDTFTKKYLKRAYEVFINDTYWLVMPAKLLDNGVRLTEIPSKTFNKTSCYGIKLQFEQGTGITNDEYTIYVHPKTGEIQHWDYILESDSTQKGSWDWDKYTDVGGVQFSLKKTNEEKISIAFPNTKVLEIVDDKLFKSK